MKYDLKSVYERYLQALGSSYDPSLDSLDSLQSFLRCVSEGKCPSEALHIHSLVLALGVPRSYFDGNVDAHKKELQSLARRVLTISLPDLEDFL